jgi:hypothetical protein
VRIKGMDAFLFSVNRKQLPICSPHYRQFEKSEYSPLNLGISKKNP